MKSESIRIVITDDHQMIRETWKLLLEQDKRFIIIAQCSNGAEAINAAKNLSPDIILMDINMRPVNGFEATRKIAQQHPSVKIIGMSVNNQPSYARNMLQLGAKGYITKNSTKEEMMNAIITVYNGGRYICEEIRDKMKDPGDNQFF
ncbi:MAG TPA: response regulator transcription factor [Chitinophagaceae bacterium]|jgi:DNA-binding NarL/FixJ family response regulator|nr:response regulator transcription factor [Chitinophagaceae bacterium]